MRCARGVPPVVRPAIGYLRRNQEKALIPGEGDGWPIIKEKYSIFPTITLIRRIQDERRP
jgi:hypothetical protein